MKFIVKAVLILAILTSLILGFILGFYYLTLPKLDDLDKQSSKQIIRINYSNENLITNRSEIEQSEVQYYELPQHLINAVIATEDRRFFSHFGINIFAVIRAFYVNKSAGKIVQGGSTITQQLAKILFLNSERTLHRKIQELLLALQLERTYSKEQILMLYLNRAYFGSGSYGIGNAAQRYFGKNVSELSLSESALLAGLLKAPSKISPKNNRKIAENRTITVLKAMANSGFLDEKEFKKSYFEPNFRDDYGQRYYFTDYVYQQVPDLIEKKDSKQKILKVTTTLNEDLQKDLESKLKKFVEKNYIKLDKSEIAVVIMNKGGEVLAMSGGNDYQKSQFNRSVFSKRQAGSVFKTFVYLSAFENGFKPDDIFEDKKINIGNWLPDNYEDRYLGLVSLRQAFAYSLNSVSAQLSRKVGGAEIANIAKLCGILSPIKKNDLTISLGTTEVSLYELTSAFATIANDGIPVIPYSVLQIKNINDEILFERKSSGFESVISKDAIKNIKDLLRQVVENGTGKKANINKKIHGKTGTSQDFRDAWFVGFDDEKVVGIWIGNDDNSSTQKISGGSLPAELFAEII